MVHGIHQLNDVLNVDKHPVMRFRRGGYHVHLALLCTYNEGLMDLQGSEQIYHEVRVLNC